MQRVRVGLTGLAVVLLLVVLTTMLLSYVQDKSGMSARSDSERQQSDDEPLSDLGIVPRAPDNAVATGNESQAVPVGENRVAP
jgi:hypothetical protein